MKGRDPNDILREDGLDAVRAASDSAKRFRPDELGNTTNGKDEGKPVGVSLNDFYAYMPMHSYIYTPSREIWPGSSINARLPPVPLFDEAGKPLVSGITVPRNGL